MNVADYWIVFGTMHVLMRYTIPKVNEHFLQLSYYIAFNTGVYVAPLTKLWFARNVIVCHIHTSRVGYSAIYHYDFAMVTMKDMVYPRETTIQADVMHVRTLACSSKTPHPQQEAKR